MILCSEGPLQSLAVSPKVLFKGVPSSVLELKLLVWQVDEGLCDQITIEFIFIDNLLHKEIKPIQWTRRISFFVPQLRNDNQVYLSLECKGQEFLSGLSAAMSPALELSGTK